MIITLSDWDASDNTWSFETPFKGWSVGVTGVSSSSGNSNIQSVIDKDVAWIPFFKISYRSVE